MCELAEPRPVPGPDRARVLQGGGALGAYQAGVYQALHEGWHRARLGHRHLDRRHQRQPDRRQRAAEPPAHAEEFWGRMAHKSLWHGSSVWPQAAQITVLLAHFDRVAFPAFSNPIRLRVLGPHLRWARTMPATTRPTPLEKTLLELVDFSLVNRCKPRLTVGAAHVRTSQMRYFDSRDMEIGVKHILASGALPPAFPAVRIDGELYWDGGILSNTPTEVIFDDNPRQNSLIFAVHMWNPIGPEPETIWEVMHRQKDIQYSSRVASHIARQLQTHRLRHVIRELARRTFPKRDATARLCASWPAMAA